MSQIPITGTINGTNGSDGNAVFTLASAPSDLLLFKDGLLQTPTASYTLVGVTVTFLAPHIPVTGAALYAEGISGSSPTPTPGTVSGNDLIYAALRIAGILLAPQRGGSNSDLTDGLLVLNSMLDAWKAERLLPFAEIRTEFDLEADQNEYYIGQVGSPDWNIERPERIERAGFIWTSVTPHIEQPFRILSDQEWAALSPKELTSTVPWMLHYQPLVPNGKVIVWPVPTDVSQVGSVALYTWQQVQQFSSTVSAAYLPPGYQEAIEYGLAVRMAARYPRRANISAWSVQNAIVAKTRIKNMNAQVLTMQVEQACRGEDNRGRYNPISNSYNYP